MVGRNLSQAIILDAALPPPPMSDPNRHAEVAFDLGLAYPW
jgi:hypothetical protein